MTFTSLLGDSGLFFLFLSVVFTGVKGSGTTSNHTIVVEKTLGIEAAR